MNKELGYNCVSIVCTYKQMYHNTQTKQSESKPYYVPTLRVELKFVVRSTYML